MTDHTKADRPTDLQSIVDRIFETLEEIPGLAEDATRAENDYDIAYASEFLQVEGTVEAKKAQITKRLSEKWLAKERALNSKKIAEQAAWNVLPKIMSVYQTLSKNDRELNERMRNGL